MNINQETAALPLDNGVFFYDTNTIVPKPKPTTLPIGTNDNSRYYRNRLYEKKMLIHLIILFQQHQRLHSVIKTL